MRNYVNFLFFCQIVTYEWSLVSILSFLQNHRLHENVWLFQYLLSCTRLYSLGLRHHPIFLVKNLQTLISYLHLSIFLSPESKYNLWVDTLVLRKMNNCISKRITQDQEKLVKSFVKLSLTEIPLPLSYDQENMVPEKPKWWSGQESSKSRSLMSK